MSERFKGEEPPEDKTEELPLSVAEADDIIAKYKEKYPEKGENLAILENRVLMAHLLGIEIAQTEVAVLTLKTEYSKEDRIDMFGDVEEFRAALAFGRSVNDVVRMGDDKIHILIGDVVANEMMAKRREKLDMETSLWEAITVGIKEVIDQKAIKDTKYEIITEDLLEEARANSEARAKELLRRYGKQE